MIQIIVSQTVTEAEPPVCDSDVGREQSELFEYDSQSHWAF